MFRPPLFSRSIAIAVGMTCVLAITGCRTPDESVRKQKGLFSSLGKKNKAQQPPPPPPGGPNGPGWNPNMQLPGGAIGRQNAYSSVPMSQPFIAMTFDDGPHPTNTPRVMDMMRQRNIKATFFVVGSSCRRYPHILRRMVAEGHEIANHTDTHGYVTKMSADTARRELSVTHQAIVAATGVAPRVFRPPYGAITSDQKAWIKSEFGYPSIMWSVDPEDWKKPGSAVVTRRLVAGAAPGGILLAHDIHVPTIDAMPSTFDQLLARGFRFVTVSQLISMEGRG